MQVSETPSQTPTGAELPHSGGPRRPLLLRGVRGSGRGGYFPFASLTGRIIAFQSHCLSLSCLRGCFFQGLDFLKFSSCEDANLQFCEEPEKLMDSVDEGKLHNRASIFYSLLLANKPTWS